MGFSMFQVKKGINLDGLAQVMSGAGVPGASGDASLAPVGSLYLNITDGQMFIKKSSGVGTDKWLRTQDSNDMAAALQGISWREPATLHVTTAYADLAAATTEMNTGTLDGTAVVANDRILFDNITGANKNVFIVTGTPGSGATLVEDTNSPTKGDAVYVTSGTDAGKTFNYNGTIWVQQGGASSTEIGFLKNFVGKSADGNEIPDYYSTNVVSYGDSLEDAIGALDSKYGNETGDPSYTVAFNPSLTVTENLVKLDVQLGMTRTFRSAITTPGVASVVDSISDGVYYEVWALSWKVYVKYNVSVWYADVTAILMNDEFDYNIASVLTVGPPIPGLEVTVEVDNGEISLKVLTTNAATVRLTRSILGNLD